MSERPHEQDGATATQRGRHELVHCELDVRYEIPEMDLEGVTHLLDLSLGGARTLLPAQVPNRTLVCLTLQPPDEETPLTIRGKTFYRLESPTGRDLAPVGITFIRLDDQTRRRLFRLLERLPR